MDFLDAKHNSSVSEIERNVVSKDGRIDDPRDLTTAFDDLFGRLYPSDGSWERGDIHDRIKRVLGAPGPDSLTWDSMSVNLA